MAIERARRARNCRSVSLMPGSGLSSFMTTTHCHAANHVTRSCAHLAEQRASEPVDQQHGKQQKQIEDREGEHLLAGGVRLPRRALAAAFFSLACARLRW